MTEKKSTVTSSSTVKTIKESNCDEIKEKKTP